MLTVNLLLASYFLLGSVDFFEKQHRLKYLLLAVIHCSLSNRHNEFEHFSFTNKAEQ